MIPVYLFTAPNDHELMSSMMNRISLLEQKISFQDKEMNEKVINSVLIFYFLKIFINAFLAMYT